MNLSRTCRSPSSVIIVASHPEGPPPPPFIPVQHYHLGGNEQLAHLSCRGAPLVSTADDAAAASAAMRMPRGLEPDWFQARHCDGCRQALPCGKQRHPGGVRAGLWPLREYNFI